MTTHLTVTNPGLVQLLSDSKKPAAKVGQRFIFVEPGALIGDTGPLSQLLAIFGLNLTGTAQAEVISMIGKTDEPMLGCLTVTGPEVDQSPLGAAFTPQRLYQVERDRAVVYLALLNRGGDTVKVVITHMGSPYRTLPVMLDEYGAARLEIPVLRTGTYRVALEEADGVSCTFEGTLFSLKPLEAIRREHYLDDSGLLTTNVFLASYGFPVTPGTPVTLELVEGGSKRVGMASGVVDAKSEVKAGFDVSHAKGELTLRVQLSQDRGKKAEVLIPGSSEADRAFTPINHSGRPSRASLLPHDGARSINGLHVSYSGETVEAPIWCDDIVTGDTIDFQSSAAALVVRIVIEDPISRSLSEVEFRDVKSGDTLSVKAPPMFGFAHIGAMIVQDDQITCWEDGRAILTESVNAITMMCPDIVRPGSEFTVGIRTDVPSAVFLIVKDARVVGDDGLTAVSGAVKRRIDGATGILATNAKVQPLNYVTYSPWDGPAVLGESLERSIMPRMAAMSLGVMEEAVSYAMPVPKGSPMDHGNVAVQTATQVAVELAVPRRDFKELYFAGIVHTSGRRPTEVTIKAGDGITTLMVEAIAISGRDTARLQKTVRVSKPVFAEISAPKQAAPGSYALISARIVTESGKAMVLATHKGHELAVSVDGRSIDPVTEIATPCDVTFMAPAGLVAVNVIDTGTGDSDLSEVRIAESGTATWVYDRVGVLTIGKTVKLDDFDATGFRLLPGLQKQVGKLTTTMGDLGWKCCEQTVVEAICTLVGILGNDDPAYVDHFMAAHAREKSMLLADGGIAFYPPKAGQPPMHSHHDHYEHLAAKYMASMRRFIDDPRLPDTVNAAVRDFATWGDDLCSFYGLPRVPETITNMRDAYLVLSLDPSRSHEAQTFVGKGMVREGQYLVADTQYYQAPRGYPVGWANETQKREQTLYGAAVLAAGGHLDYALAAVNYALAQTDKDGRLPSTSDSLALLEALGALLKRGVGAVTDQDAKVRLNGELDLSLADALAYTGPITSITAVTAPAVVFAYEVTVVQDWFADGGQELARVKVPHALKPYQEATMTVDLVDGYQPGDRVQIAFDSSMVAPEYGGDRFIVDIDFEGRKRIELPVAALAASLDASGARASHTVVAYVYNMFDDNRRGPATAPYFITA